MPDDTPEEFLFINKPMQISILGRIPRNPQPLFTGFSHRFGAPRTENYVKPEGDQTIFKPGEIIVPASLDHLIDLSGEMEAVDNPGVVALKFEESHPGSVGFHCLVLFTWLEVDQAAAPGEIGEGTPFCRNDGGMIAVLPLTDDLWMLVEGKSNFSLKGESGPLKDDLWAELDAHGR